MSATNSVQFDSVAGRSSVAVICTLHCSRLKRLLETGKQNKDRTRGSATPTYSARFAARFAIGQFQFVENDVTAGPEFTRLRRLRVYTHALCINHTTTYSC